MRLAPPLVVLALLGACSTPADPEPVPVDRPNIVVFTLDTTRADMLGCYGNPVARTPVIDGLAAQGALFGRAYTVTPLTIPAHSSLHTGLYPPRHGVRDNGDHFLDEGALTLAEVLNGAGYATMASVGAEVTSHHWGFAQGFDAYFDDMGDARSFGADRWKVERRADEVVADALRWFESDAAGEAPWFAWIHMFDPHHPYEPPVEYQKLLAGKPYQGEIAYTDAQVGVLLDALEARGELDDTWVFVLADHGEGMGSHGEGAHGVLLYDATTRIPFVVRPPGGLPEQRVVRSPVSIVDVVPTVLSAAGLPVPEGLDGVDLTGMLAPDAPAAEARDLYVESLYAYHVFGWAPQHALVDPEYKLIDSTTPELYGREDMAESRDLAPKAAERLAAMQKRLSGWMDAMEPDADAAAPVAMSAERTAQLAALGYMTGGGDLEAPTGDLPDPVSRLPVLAQMEQARQAMQTDDRDTLRTVTRALIEEEPRWIMPRQMLLTVLLREGQLDEAMALARGSYEIRQSNQTTLMLGSVHLARGEMDLGLEKVREALDIDPYQEASWILLLRNLVALRDPVRLRQAVEEARIALPESTAILGMEGVLLAAEGNDGEAERLLLVALDREPAIPLAHHALGEIYARRGDMALAEEHLLQEVEIEPMSVSSRKALVALYAQQARYDDQLAQLEKIMELAPADHLTWHSYAQVLFNLSRFEDAHKAVGRCREAAPGYPACAMLEANTLDKLGRPDEAKAAYEHALELGETSAARRP